VCQGCWVRQSQLATGLDAHLFESVEAWIAKDWPLEKPAYPGRRIAYDDWRALQDVSS